MIVSRDLESVLAQRAAKMPVIALLGPRQSGKTTLAKKCFSKHVYVSLENFDDRERALLDPKKFLASYINEHGVIIDEIQHAPRLLSYIQTLVDEHPRPGAVVITGSQNLLMSEAVSQSLAGRVSIMTLLPFSIPELRAADLLPSTIEAYAYRGGYPRIYAYDLDPTTWYLDYIETYVERDVRMLANIADLVTFRRFMRLCAGRVGQILNVALLAVDCGIDQKTAKAWLSVLEASYIVFRLEPHYENFSKRIIKSPKLYFYDSGLVCALLGIKSAESLDIHHLRGGIIESMLITEVFKYYYHRGERPQQVFFWKNQAGEEIDCVIQKGNHLVPIEIKASTTVHSDFFKTLIYWKKLTQSEKVGYLLYAGDKNQDWQHGKAISWKNIDGIF